MCMSVIVSEMCVAPHIYPPALLAVASGQQVVLCPSSVLCIHTDSWGFIITRAASASIQNHCP